MPQLTTLPLHRHFCVLPVSPHCSAWGSAVRAQGWLPTSAARAAPSLGRHGGAPRQPAVSLWLPLPPPAHCFRSTPMDVFCWPHHSRISLGATGSGPTPLPPPSIPTATLSPAGQQPSGSCVTIACEICFVMFFLHHYTTD